MKLQYVFVGVNGFKDSHKSVIFEVHILKSKLVQRVVRILNERRTDVATSLTCEIVLRQVQLGQVTGTLSLNSLGKRQGSQVRQAVSNQVQRADKLIVFAKRCRKSRYISVVKLLVLLSLVLKMGHFATRVLQWKLALLQEEQITFETAR